MTDPTSMVEVAPLTEHPAKFSEPILDALRNRITAEARRVRREEPGTVVQVLDPMAGVGRIHQLHDGKRVWTTGVEIQPRWAACHSRTICADYLEWAGRPGNYRRFHIAATSPTYANRMADHHDARDDSTRYSYRHVYGEELEPGNSGTMPWGPAYRRFHADMHAWVRWNLAPGGLYLLNVSNHYRGEEEVPVIEFHRGACLGVGFEEDGRVTKITTKRLRGVGDESTAKRAKYEVILRFRAPLTPPGLPEVRRNGQGT